jgi:UDP-N-acetylglucosamine 2-epimerase (non-hydrolysing)
VIVHTGQHYDAQMSDSFFEELRIPQPQVNLGIGSSSHAVQTGAMLAALEPVLVQNEPDWVLAYGDTNSTLAAAVCAVKLHLPLAHLEAGLRSYNRRMPEEHNRILTDHASDLCLAPTPHAVATLAEEGLSERTVLVGDVMVDVLARVLELEAASRDTSTATAPPFVLATIHRAENTDDEKRLRAIVDALAGLPCEVRLPTHPRLLSRCRELGIDLSRGAVHPVPPMGYQELVRNLAGAAAVVTDSGGLQKEAYVVGIPATTLRSETEWVETLHGDWNVLVADPANLAEAVARPRPVADRGHPFGEGHAAGLVLDALSDGTGRPEGHTR